MSADSTGTLSILDDLGPNPTLDLVPSNDLLVSPYVGAVLESVALSSTNGLDVVSSASTYKAHVLSADGTVQAVDYTYMTQVPFTGPLFFGTTASALTTPAGSSIAVLYTLHKTASS